MSQHKNVKSGPDSNTLKDLEYVMRVVGQNLASLTNLMQGQSNRNSSGSGSTGISGGSTTRPTSMLYKRFQELNPPDFEGTEMVLTATEWIKQLEEIFEVLECSIEERVHLATFSLKKEAGCWWEDKRRTFPDTIDTWSWDQFKNQFEDKYLLSHTRDELRVEFLTLKQGNMTVEQYSTRFMELSRYAPEIIQTEELKTEQFINGLKPCLWDKVRILRPTQFEDALVAAQILEKESDQTYHAAKSQKRQKRRFEDQDGQKPFKTQTDGGRLKGQWKDDCATCGKKHRGICRLAGKECYRCGEMGHKRSRCPMKQRRTSPQTQQQQKQQSWRQVQEPPQQ